jgi:CheY-like chemotaxis protein
MRFRTWLVAALGLSGLLLLINVPMLASSRKAEEIYTQLDQLNADHQRTLPRSGPKSRAGRPSFARSCGSEILVLDIGMPRLNGIEVAARTQKLDRPPGVIILSMHADESYIIRALAARGRTLEQGSGHTAQCGIVDRRNTSRESDAEAESPQHGRNRALRRSKGHRRIRRARTVHYVPSIPTRISGPYRMAARDHFPAAFPFGHARR